MTRHLGLFRIAIAWSIAGLLFEAFQSMPALGLMPSLLLISAAVVSMTVAVLVTIDHVERTNSRR